MRSREDSKPARGTLAALRFHLTQEGVRIALHLGDATATADVDGLPFDAHGDGWSHAAQRLACDGAGFLSSVRTLREKRGRSGLVRCGRIGAIGLWRGQRISGRGTGSGQEGGSIVWCRASTATAAATAATIAAISAAA